MFLKREIIIISIFSKNRSSWKLNSMWKIKCKSISTRKKNLKKNNEKKMIIETLSCASMNDVCIIMFKFKNFETKIYFIQSVNAFFYDIMNLNEIFRQIFRHFNHAVNVSITVNDKTFARQIKGLSKLFKKQTCAW